jgi:uncharacterized integral membrane protein (TIGR00698 family)
MKQGLHEDWIAVCLALLSIVLIIAGITPMMPRFSWTESAELQNSLLQGGTYINIGQLLLWGLGSLIIFYFLNNKKINLQIIPGLLLILLISMLAQMITGNQFIKGIGIEIVLFSLLVGLFISNVIGIPEWLKPALQTELFIKVGLVLLGSSILFQELLKGGAYGILQSVVVVFSVWYFTFWICKKIGLDDEFRMMLASAVSICGVSAAIATSGAIEGDKKKLSHVISLVLIVAIPMMIFMPYIAKWMNMSPAVAGAWLGGTIDTSGAVVAAGTMLGEEALKYATLVKFSQNVLLGLAAFLISIWWTYKGDAKNPNAQKPSLRTIWERFPKFVLGFIAVSILFSFAIPTETVAAVKGPIKDLQTFYFALAFACIGLETKFTDIFRMDGGRPALAFIIAQVFNVLVTLVMAYLVFGQMH